MVVLSPARLCGACVPRDPAACAGGMEAPLTFRRLARSFATAAVQPRPPARCALFQVGKMFPAIPLSHLPSTLRRRLLRRMATMAILSWTKCLPYTEGDAFARAEREPFWRGAPGFAREVPPPPTTRPRQALARLAGHVWRGGDGWTPFPRDCWSSRVGRLVEVVSQRVCLRSTLGGAHAFRWFRALSVDIHRQQLAAVRQTVVCGFERALA